MNIFVCEKWLSSDDWMDLKKEFMDNRKLSNSFYDTKEDRKKL